MGPWPGGWISYGRSSTTSTPMSSSIGTASDSGSGRSAQNSLKRRVPGAASSGRYRFMLRPPRSPRSSMRWMS